MSELIQAFLESRTRGIEGIESLQWLEWGAKKWETATYLVQMVDESHQIAASMASHPLLILLRTKYVTDFIVKLRRRLVEATELIQGTV